jgi:hypothetical protein
VVTGSFNIVIGTFGTDGSRTIRIGDPASWDKAVAASDRALLRIYGPRKLRVLEIKADALKGKGDLAGARRTIEEAVAFAEALPPGQRSDGRVAGLRKKLDSLREPGPAPSS